MTAGRDLGAALPSDKEMCSDRVCLASWGAMFSVCIVVISVSSGGWHFTAGGGTAQKCSHHDQRLQSTFGSVCLDGGTEAPFSSPYDGVYNRTGVYRCACCGEPLFPASTKYDSGTGWPSFWAPVEGDPIGYAKDVHAGMTTEVHCQRCGAHLGHVFGGFTGGGDGETNYRYCINGVCLKYDALTELPLAADVPWTTDAILILCVAVAAPFSLCGIGIYVHRLTRAYRTGLCRGSWPCAGGVACRRW